MPTGTAMELLEIFDSGTSITIPGGFSQVEIWSVGAGGPARRGGGGGGGIAYRLYPLLAAEWGTTLTISVGQSVAGSAGGNTTVNGTLNGSAITELKGFGGARGGTVSGGVGGTASGGDTNTPGTDGTEYDAGGPTYGDGGLPGEETAINLLQGVSYARGGAGAASGDTVGTHGAVICFWKQ